MAVFKENWDAFRNEKNETNEKVWSNDLNSERSYREEIKEN